MATGIHGILAYIIVIVITYVTAFLYKPSLLKKKAYEVNRHEILSAFVEGLVTILLTVLAFLVIILYASAEYRALLINLTAIVGSGIASGFLGTSVYLLFIKVMYSITMKKKQKDM